ncbi:hypothetical protein DPMN_109952 [Dreissena polymorpha]|uniref:Uncharacterized protein n=1 Tax=Dreissena polymorpha TaxID=45954 RepID=A0A9D4QNI8_DREPO|nr:hypothetical protein DPMN_109952 [Dreissena polymorpha]
MKNVTPPKASFGTTRYTRTFSRTFQNHTIEPVISLRILKYSILKDHKACTDSEIDQGSRCACIDIFLTNINKSTLSHQCQSSSPTSSRHGRPGGLYHHFHCPDWGERAKRRDL